MRDIKEQVTEIYSFLDSYKGSLPVNASTRSAITKAYKKFHSVLIWQNNFDKSSSFSHDIKLYMNEATSDLSQSLLCSLLGLYKPARVMLRSSLENLMRVSALLYKLDPLALKTVHELIDLFKSTDLRNNNTTDKAVHLIISMYGDLCGYVHTSSPMNMALRIPFSRIFENDDAQRIACLSDVGKVANAANHIISFQCSKRFGKMHHRDADYVRDQLPAALKRDVSQKS